jgi:DNA-binding transcriptional ArsR family regulator
VKQDINDPPVFRAIADPTRRQILDQLRETGALRVGDIAANFKAMSRIAVSKHLRVLHEADLIQSVDSEDGRERLFALKPDGLAALREWMHHYDVFWQEKLQILKRLAEDTDDAQP